MIISTQRKMLRFIIQTKRKYKKKVKKSNEEKRQETMRSQQTMKKLKQKKIATELIRREWEEGNS